MSPRIQVRPGAPARFPSPRAGGPAAQAPTRPHSPSPSKWCAAVCVHSPPAQAKTGMITSKSMLRKRNPPNSCGASSRTQYFSPTTYYTSYELLACTLTHIHRRSVNAKHTLRKQTKNQYAAQYSHGTICHGWHPFYVHRATWLAISVYLPFGPAQHTLYRLHLDACIFAFRSHNRIALLSTMASAAVFFCSTPCIFLYFPFESLSSVVHPAHGERNKGKKIGE